MVCAVGRAGTYGHTDTVTDTCCGGVYAVCGEGVWVYMDRLARRRVAVVTDACCGGVCAVCGEGVWAYGQVSKKTYRHCYCQCHVLCWCVCAVCGAGTYGQDCRETCGRCQDGAACNHISGHCSACASHFTMPFCSGESREKCGEQRSVVVN